jgi:acetyl esterase/lipase
MGRVTQKPTDPREVLERPAPDPDLTLTYGPLPEHVADVRWGPAGGPLVIVVHGGFWRAGFDRHHTGAQCVGLVEAGFTVAAIEYRRTGMPGGGWPGTLDDVLAAVRAVPALVREAAASARRAVATDATVLVGHSAGGHLVAWAATHPLPDVVGAVSLAGVLDLALAADLDPGPDGTAVQALLGGRPDDVPDRAAAADPTRLGRPVVAVVAVHGDADTTVPVQVSRSYAAATGQRLVELAGVDHFAVIDPRSAAWPEVIGAVRSAGHPATR